MKRIASLFVLISFSFNAFSQSKLDIQNNGSIIEELAYNGSVYVYRYHQQVVQISEATSLVLRDEPSLNDSKIVQKLELFEQVTISKIVVKKSGTGVIELWLFITTKKNATGWIFAGNEDPYSTGVGKIIDIYKTESRTWTIRTIENTQLIAADRLNVRDKPGLEGSTTIFQIKKEDYQDVKLEKKGSYFYYGMYVTVLAKTDEKDLINGVSEYWVKIRDRNGREGFVFGGFLDMGDIGGPKYTTADSIISYGVCPP